MSYLSPQQADELDEENGHGFVCTWANHQGDCIHKVIYNRHDIPEEIEMGDGSTGWLAEVSKRKRPLFSLSRIKAEEQGAIPAAALQELPVSDEFREDFLDCLALHADFLSKRAQAEPSSENIDKAAASQEHHEKWMKACERGFLDSIYADGVLPQRERHAKRMQQALQADDMARAAAHQRMVAHFDALIEEHGLLN